MEYNPSNIEGKWRKHWDEKGIYKVSHDSDKPKYYVLDMFPYPSGSGLHVGHPLGYIASDIFARFKRLKGFNVLHPMGYDAFGIPAEQYAIDTGVHPGTATDKNIERYREQLDNIGFSFDWSRAVKTSDPSYYKWTQWIFIQLFEHYYDQKEKKARSIESLIATFSESGNQNVHAATTQESFFDGKAWRQMSAKEQDEVLMNYRLAYRKVSYVNWCEELGTVLSNDEVKDGVSERGGFPVERKPMMQWSLRITAYAERLLKDMEALDWSESMKKTQSNWIGRSEGAQMFFPIDGHDTPLEVFTTRPDTIFGVTFLVVAPEHPLVQSITTTEQKTAIETYLDYTKNRSERERMAEVKEVTGAFTGAYAINPLNGKKLPIYIGEYVLMDYGTGAIMAVPSDDDRDHAFATHFGIEIIDVIDKSNYPGSTRHDKEGLMINSEFLDGMEVPAAIEHMMQAIEAKDMGKRRINYKLRDAQFSRQRYWGEPFPITYNSEGIAKPLPIEELPLELPILDDFKPTPGVRAPLEKLGDWTQLSNGDVREVDTMPGFAGSSWYFLRYMDAHNPDSFASKEALAYWQDVDLYVGGTEHATGHLMYSRFWHKFLYDKGLVPTQEPFKKLINQGMIQGVIEYICFLKEKQGGKTVFVSADQLFTYPENEWSQMPVHVDFIKAYGTPGSHLTTEGVAKFQAWRPGFEEAIFQYNGDGKLMTISEVGKMSKRYFNVVNPDDVIATYGADCFRMYEMFLGPIDQSKPWDTNGIDGVSKFLRKLWALFYDEQGKWLVNKQAPSKEARKVLHATIKKIQDDIERFSFNTCISAFMVCVNDLRKLDCHSEEILQDLVVILAPFAPHITEELWHAMAKEGSVHQAMYPAFQASYLVEDEVEMPVSINGKKRAIATFPTNTNPKEVEAFALAMPEVQKWTEGMTIKKVIVVPNRMINIVVG